MKLKNNLKSIKVKKDSQKYFFKHKKNSYYNFAFCTNRNLLINGATISGLLLWTSW